MKFTVLYETQFGLGNKQYVVSGVKKGKRWVLAYVEGIGYVQSERLNDAHKMTKKDALDYVDGADFMVYKLSNLKQIW